MTAAPTSEPFLFTPEAAGPNASSKDAGRRDAGATGSAEQLVNQARQEISQIVREVASVQRSEGGRDRYLRFLSDRILRAMAAHGVVIWKATDDNSALGTDPDTDLHFLAEHRIGTVTDRQFDSTTAAVHDCLLIEVAGHNEPVVVPPTPGASDREVPANPTEHPAAIVPVQIDPGSALPTCLIEVFMEPGGSPASQRGALRFLAQMGDLAGEYLRTERLRSMSHLLSSLEQSSQTVDRLLELTSTAQVEAAWVDAIATSIGCPRVALCRIDQGRPKIVAVNHVDRIDHHGESAEVIRSACEVPLSRKGALAFATIEPPPAQNTIAPESQDDGASQTERRQRAGRRDTDLETRPVCPHWVVALSSDSQWRVVLLERDGDSERWIDPSADVLAVLYRVQIGAQQAWRAARRIEAIPGGKWIARLTAPTESADSISLANDSAIVSSLQRQSESTVSPLRRRLAFGVALVVTTALLLCLPIPSMVNATGMIRPVDINSYHAHHDATIKTIHIDHGQNVQKGDLLVTLVSQDLNQQQATLLGRRAVLAEKREHFNRQLMSPDRDSRDSSNFAAGDEIEEEIISIDQQLSLLEQSQSKLVLRALRNGRVDAWRIAEQLANRPLRRGDIVLKVIAAETNWIVDATIEQKRIGQVDRAIENKELSAEASPRWSPDQTQPAQPHRFGPVVTNPVDGTSGVVLRMNLAHAPDLGDQPLAETPARITLRCGRTSVGSFLFDDVVVWLRTRIGSYL